MKRRIKTREDLELDVKNSKRAGQREKNAKKEKSSDQKVSKHASVIIAAAIMFGLFSTTDGPQALTIKNGDTEAHTLMIVENGKSSELVLLQAQVATHLCVSACEVFVGVDPAPYEVVAGEVATIRQGKLDFEDPGPIKASAPGGKQ